MVATAIGLAIGVPAAVCLVRGRFSGREAATSLMLLPLIVPGIVLGLALYIFQVETEIATGWAVLGSLGGLIAGLLFEVRSTDLVTFAAVALLLAVVAAVACWIPTRRATRIDPVDALRAG